MLVLSRKRDESIVIGNCITVTVLEVKGNRIRLAISAPREIPVRRGELEPLERALDASLSMLGPTAV
jgi:carbon storage regulator